MAILALWFLPQSFLQRKHYQAEIAVGEVLQIRIGGGFDHGHVALIVEQGTVLYDTGRMPTLATHVEAGR